MVINNNNNNNNQSNNNKIELIKFTNSSNIKISAKILNFTLGILFLHLLYMHLLNYLSALLQQKFAKVIKCILFTTSLY